MRPGRGVTLPELMIVLVVSALLATLAWPAYQAQLQRARRGQARLLLLSTAQRLERMAAARGDEAYAPQPWGEGPVLSAGGAYRLEVVISADGRGYSLAAVPVDPRQVGDACGTLLLDHQGRQALRGARAGLSAADCWAR